MEELQCKTVFTIPVFGGIPIAESVAVTWIIMAVLLILSLVLVRNLRDVYKRQVLIFKEGLEADSVRKLADAVMNTCEGCCAVFSRNEDRCV